jgi:hypothetical protein
MTMDPILSGFGLASAAGLNAYIPLLLLGIAGRLGYADLSAPYTILSSTPGLVVLAVLLLVELLADKVPGVDHVNDIINTVVRPAAGGLLFVTSAGAGQLDPTLAAILGLVTAGSVHFTKAGFRPLVTATTGGLGNPVVSVIEDVLALVGTILAIFAPILVALFLIVLIVAALVFWRRLRARRARRRVGATASP